MLGCRNQKQRVLRLMGMSFVLQIFGHMKESTGHIQICQQPDDGVRWNVGGSRKFLQFTLRGNMNVGTRFHPIVIEKFHSKPQMWTSRWRERESQGITKVIRIHHLGIMNICTKWKSICSLLRYFSLDQSDGPTHRQQCPPWSLDNLYS